jgi:hypothetical protein
MIIPLSILGHTVLNRHVQVQLSTLMHTVSSYTRSQNLTLCMLLQLQATFCAELSRMCALWLKTDFLFACLGPEIWNKHEQMSSSRVM